MPPGIAVTLDQMRSALLALRSDDSGATVIEYALILVLISITVVAWATFVGTSVSNFFMQIANGF
jgi:Flp pilus assembly pilin Flp